MTLRGKGRKIALYIIKNITLSNMGSVSGGWTIGTISFETSKRFPSIYHNNCKLRIPLLWRWLIWRKTQDLLADECIGKNDM